MTFEHYHGRMCPIETPEGQTLVGYPKCFAKVNNLGFIETPYREVKDGVVDFSKMKYLTAEEEQEKLFAQAHAKRYK